MKKSQSQKNSKFKKVLVTTLAMAFTLPLYSIEAPKKTMNDGYQNINNRKEYTYDTRPELVFWREGGRPYWRSNSSASTRMSELEIVKAAFESWVSEEKVRFGMEQAKLDPADRKMLKKLAERLSDDRDGLVEVWVLGFASRPGTRSFNQELSEKRAKNVKDFLVEQGVDSALIKMTAYGESRSLASEDASRRVEIKITEI